MQVIVAAGLQVCITDQKADSRLQPKSKFAATLMKIDVEEGLNNRPCPGSWREAKEMDFHVAQNQRSGIRGILWKAREKGQTRSDRGFQFERKPGNPLNVPLLIRPSRQRRRRGSSGPWPVTDRSCTSDSAR